MKTITIPLVIFIFCAVSLAGAFSCSCEDDDDDDDNDNDIGEILSDDSGLKEPRIGDAPPMFIDPARPMSGATVHVRVKAPGSTNIDLTMTGDGCGSLAAVSGPTPLEITGAVADNGSCFLTANATMSDGDTQVLQGFFEIQASNPDIPPIEVIGGAYSFQPLPTPSTEDGRPIITAVEGPATYINGGTASFAVSYSGAEQVSQLALAVAGYEGHFLVPVSGSGGVAQFDLSFDSDIFDQLTAKAGEVRITLELIDAVAEVGDPLDIDLAGVEVESGEVKVSLSWDTPTDVDLHVIEPSGFEIYYSNKVSPSGGTLDLDSNAGCSIDGVNNENIYWPEGASPSGDFTVTAHMWSDCEEGGASGTVTMTFCGDDSPIYETFSLGPSGSSESWSFTSLCGSRVSGTMKYEDFMLSSAGLAAAGQMVPIRFAKVQVVRKDDDEVLAETHTNSEGKYDIGFLNEGEPGYYVRLIAQSELDTFKQEVLNLDGKYYSWKSDVFDETIIPKNENVNIEVPRDKEAGAWNIWDCGYAGWLEAWKNTGRIMPLVKFYWTKGEKPQGKNYSFATSQMKIFVLSDAADADEYDDLVLGHEYGHLTQMNYSKFDSVAVNSHSPWTEAPPTLAFSEGWATYFGNSIYKVTTYLDTNPNGVGFSFDIETLDPGIPLGNKPKNLSGELTEGVTAAVLQDLADATNESKDTVNKPSGIWKVLTGYMQKDNPKFKDRGVAGRDLVDFLDGWYCLGLSYKDDDNSKGVRGVVIGLHELSYDFADVDSCK